MDLPSFRDLVLIVWGIISSAVMVYLCIVVADISRKTKSTMVSIDEATEKIKEIADRANEEVVEPLSKIGSVLRGINQGLGFISKIILGKESK